MATKSDFERLLRELSNGSRSYAELAKLTGRSEAHVADTVRRLGLPRQPRGSGAPRQPSPENLHRIAQIVELCDGSRTSAEIAALVGSTPKYVQRVMREQDLSRLPQGARHGELNHSYVSGRTIDLDGYALVSVPAGHLSARKSHKKTVAMIYEHRLIAEQSLGRHLQAGEVVDHIDGLQLHNHPDNLRVFASNADHLRATITGEVPDWSHLAVEKMNSTLAQREAFPRIDSYRAARARGDVRLRQILLAWLRFGEASPYLSGTRHWLERAQIRDVSRPSLERHLQALDRRYKLAPALSALG